MTALQSEAESFTPLILHLVPNFPKTHLECTAMTSWFSLGGAR